jgi:hypothetical protein
MPEMLDMFTTRVGGWEQAKDNRKESVRTSDSSECTKDHRKVSVGANTKPTKNTAPSMAHKRRTTRRVSVRTCDSGECSKDHRKVSIGADAKPTKTAAPTMA